MCKVEFPLVNQRLVFESVTKMGNVINESFPMNLLQPRVVTAIWLDVQFFIKNDPHVPSESALYEMKKLSSISNV